MSRPGQAMIETVLAVLIVTFVFLVLWRLSFLLTGKILAEHAAMRVSRARSVGLNAFACEKTARVATLPVAGRRLWPSGDDLDWRLEEATIPVYMVAPNEPVARGVLDYDGWRHLRVEPGDGTESRVSLAVSLFGGECGDADVVRLEGSAGVEPNFTLYMSDQGR